MPVAAQRISRVLTLKLVHSNWFWFMAVHSSVDTSDISSVSFSFITVARLSCLISNPYAFCWAWSSFWIILRSDSKEIHTALQKKQSAYLFQINLKLWASNNFAYGERFNMGCTQATASIILPVRTVCPVMAPALPLSMSHNKPVTSLQRVSFH